MKKLICLIATVLGLAAIIPTCVFAYTEPSYKEQSYLAYYKFLEDELASMGNMIFASACISVLVAALTVLAYRRNCKKVINK